MMMVVIIILALAGVPLFAVLALGAIGGYWHSGLDPLLAGLDFARLGQYPILAALPAFTFTGVVLARGRTPGRMASLVQSLLGGRPAGRIVGAAVMGSVLAALTGSPGLAALAVGGLLLSSVMSETEAAKSESAVTALGVSPGVVLAPSASLVLYALVARGVAPRAGVDVEAIFWAGLLPAMSLLLLLGVSAFWIHRDSGRERRQAEPLVPALRRNAWELAWLVVVLGAMVGGWLRIVDAAVVSAAWMLVTAVVIRGEVRLRELPEIVTEAVMLSAVALILFGMSMAWASLVVDTGLPERVVSYIDAFVGGRAGFLLALGFLLVAAGLVLDAFAVVLVLAPLLIPVAAAFGVDPLHLGIVMVAAVQAGGCIRLSGPGIGPDDTGPGSIMTRRWLGIVLLWLSIVVAWPAFSLVLPLRLGG